MSSRSRLWRQPVAVYNVRRVATPASGGLRPAARLVCCSSANSRHRFPHSRSFRDCHLSASIHTTQASPASSEPTASSASVGNHSIQSIPDDGGPIDTIILDGKKTADVICDDIQHLVQHYQATLHTDDRPGLAVIIVGDRRDSLRYVQRKTEQANRLGFHSQLIRLPHSTTTQQLLLAIEQLNGDKRVHGVLVQLPLPAHVEQNRVLERVDIEKDVDGFHPYNMGLLALNWKGAGQFVPWEKVHRTIEVSRHSSQQYTCGDCAGAEICCVAS